MVSAALDAEDRPGQSAERPGDDSALLSVVDVAIRLTGADIAGALLADEGGDSAVMRACAGGWTVHSANLRVHRGRGLAGRIMQTRKPWKVDDYRCDTSVHAEEFMPVLTEEGTRSGLGAPMLAGNTLVGVLMVWSRRLCAFDAEATQALVNLANVAAAAVSSARRAEDQRGELTALTRRCRELAERDKAHRLVAEARDELTAMLLAGHDLQALLTTLCTRTGGDAVIFDGSLGELAAVGLADPIRRRAARFLRRSGSEPSTVLPPTQDFPRWTLLRSVGRDGEPLARIALCLTHRPTSVDRDTAGQAAAACALHLTWERAVSEARLRVHGDFVWQLLEGLVDEALAEVRARQLGCTLPARARVVLIPMSHGDDREPDRRRLDLMVGAAERLAGSAGAKVLAGRRGGTLALIADIGDDTAAARTVVERVVRGLRPHAPVAPGIAGVSVCVDWSADLRAPHRQATQALAAAASGSEGPVVLFEDLGVLQFLLAPSDHIDQARFARSMLGPVMDYDRQHHTELLETLRAYFENGCNLARAAERLYVHPKTVRYRLRRVEELTHRDLSEQQHRFDVQLAIGVLRALALENGQDTPPGSADGGTEPATLS